MTNLDILVLLVVVVLLFLRLRSVLGTRPIQEKRIRLSKENAEKLYNILKAEAEKLQGNEPSEKDDSQSELVPEGEPLNEVDKSLMEIPTFNKNKFLKLNNK